MIQAQLNVSLEELCQLEQIESDLLVEIVEYGIVRPIEGTEYHEWLFESSSVHWIRKAIRLYRDFEIDWVAVALVIELMKKNQDLREENQQIRQRLMRFDEES